MGCQLLPGSRQPPVAAERLAKKVLRLGEVSQLGTHLPEVTERRCEIRFQPQDQAVALLCVLVTALLVPDPGKARVCLRIVWVEAQRYLITAAGVGVVVLLDQGSGEVAVQPGQVRVDR